MLIWKLQLLIVIHQDLPLFQRIPLSTYKLFFISSTFDEAGLINLGHTLCFRVQSRVPIAISLWEAVYGGIYKIQHCWS